MKYLEQGPELYYLLGGALAAFVMAVMRSFQYTRKQFALRLVEAFMCSMLTASFAVSLHAFWDLSFVWAIPAGTVIGFLGTDLIHGLIVSMLEFYATKQTGGVVRLDENRARERERERGGYRRHGSGLDRDMEDEYDYDYDVYGYDYGGHDGYEKYDDYDQAQERDQRDQDYRSGSGHVDNPDSDYSSKPHRSAYSRRGQAPYGGRRIPFDPTGAMRPDSPDDSSDASNR